MTPLNIRTHRLYDLFALMTLFVIHFACLKYFENFFSVDQEGRRWIAICLSVIPTLFLFALFRSFSTPKAALAGASLIEVLLSFSHWTKLQVTNEPLVWSDFITLWDNSVLPKYLKFHHFILIFIFIFWSFGVTRKTFKTFRFSSFLNPWSFFSLLLIPFVFFPKLNILQLTYHQIDWRRNVQMNGLLSHLIQTSQKSATLQYSESDKFEFENLLSKKESVTKRPKQIIFILCESCWYDESHFKNLFQPLFERGFKSFRSISPAYGGGTPNATFEILTGLPSINNHLKGIIYQEYATSLSPRVHALPRYLLNEGYSTLALHNNLRTFWQRHIVNPKFGFEKYIGLEEMPHNPSADWPDDGVLFSIGLENLNKQKNNPIFSYFTTIYTHGPYEPQNDLGEASYKRKIQTSISRLSYFIDEVYKSDPNTLVFIFGDHKPGLTEYFIKEGLFSAHDLELGTNWDKIGDVPIFIKHPDAESLERVVTTAQGLPFFCAVEALDHELMGTGLPAFTYTRQMKLCENYFEKGYSYYKTAYPKWLYAISLFEKEPARMGKIRTSPKDS